MNRIYEVTLTKTAAVLIAAFEADEAQEIAESASNYIDWEYDVDVYPATPGMKEEVWTEDGLFTYATLVELKGWIDAVSAAEALDPNQGELFQ